MIPPTKFRELRLRKFVNPRDVAELNDWEFLGHVWVGEAVGFTEWLRRAEEPDELGCVSIDFNGLSCQTSAAMLGALELTLRSGMSRTEVERVLGHPFAEDKFVAGRVSLEFTYQSYYMIATLDDTGGLTHLTVSLHSPCDTAGT
ncbi:MAG: hypothetical protein HY763_17080 [Planctomycetes bacterium]|nr:hypothetical protein [Planctomycetota bacterium]